ncbi:MAG: hydrogenase expression/formation protein, partial [Calditrichaeota bacterium]|nr:hydrogenase expression/formation protein [Calditrichota bacterium]
MKPGKLDPDFLEKLIRSHTSTDNRIIVGSKIGEDATVIDMGKNVLIAKTDPITFVTDQIGYYAVQVNANDIACMGGDPKWFLATILLPVQSGENEIKAIFEQISAACKNEGIAFCGGHTEVTLGLDRPIVIGQMLGEAEKANVVLKSNAGESDHIILAKEIPIEGTAIIAREKESELKKIYPQDFIHRCQKFLFEPGIGVRKAAKIAMNTARVHAMHDPTEGGLATALHELAHAAGLGILIEYSRIPFSREGKELCEHFGLNPLGLIASGSLIVVVPAEDVHLLLA